MLRLITNKPNSETQHKLWFSDDDHDLFVWLDIHNNPVGFQLCYNKTVDEHAIEWQQHKGYSHTRIDSGEKRSGRYKMTPVMIADGQFKQKEVAELFRDISQHIDRDIMTYVYEHIIHCPELD